MQSDKIIMQSNNLPDNWKDLPRAEFQKLWLQLPIRVRKVIRAGWTDHERILQFWYSHLYLKK